MLNNKLTVREKSREKKQFVLRSTSSKMNMIWAILGIIGIGAQCFEGVREGEQDLWEVKIPFFRARIELVMRDKDYFLKKAKEYLIREAEHELITGYSDNSRKIFRKAGLNQEKIVLELKNSDIDNHENTGDYFKEEGYMEEAVKVYRKKYDYCLEEERYYQAFGLLMKQGMSRREAALKLARTLVQKKEWGKAAYYYSLTDKEDDKEAKKYLLDEFDKKSFQDPSFFQYGFFEDLYLDRRGWENLYEDFGCPKAEAKLRVARNIVKTDGHDESTYRDVGYILEDNSDPLANEAFQKANEARKREGEVYEKTRQEKELKRKADEAKLKAEENVNQELAKQEPAKEQSKNEQGESNENKNKEEQENSIRRNKIENTLGMTVEEILKMRIKWRYTEIDNINVLWNLMTENLVYCRIFVADILRKEGRIEKAKEFYLEAYKDALEAYKNDLEGYQYTLKPCKNPFADHKSDYFFYNGGFNLLSRIMDGLASCCEKND